MLPIKKKLLQALIFVGNECAVGCEKEQLVIVVYMYTHTHMRRLFC
jgi:hypothetical protein